MRLISILLLCLVFSTDTAIAQNKHQTTLTQVEFEANPPKDGNIVLGIFTGGELGRFGKAIDKNTDGGLSHAVNALAFDGKAMSTKEIVAPKGSKYQRILLVGLGDKGQAQAPLKWQEIGGNAVQQAVSSFKSAPPMLFDVPPNTLSQLAYGAKLGSYYFDKYFNAEDKQKSQQQLIVTGNEVTAAKQYYQSQLNPVADAIYFTRDISNEPANIIYPESFVERWSGHFKGMKNVTIKVIDEKQMLEMGMGAIYGVGRGSVKPPRMMIVEYHGADAGDAPVMFVGKGITFDSGGISIKGSKNMWNMKFDMSGAASVMGTLYALAGRKAKVNAVAIAALAENMPGGNAQRPGDVVTSMSGKTIQIRSTDAEGRLVLADGMYYGDTKYNPAVLIDVATLTGSASRALGKDYAALFSRHDSLVEKIEKTGKVSGEGVWHLPLNDGHFEAIENDVADVMNSSTTDTPGASAGAAFVGTFVRPETLWAHLDIAGVSRSENAVPLNSSTGSTAFGIRLLNEFVKQYYEKH